jgi:polyisoprenoid-binding protein YceI
MKNLSFKSLGILLVAALLIAGCASAGASQATSTSAPANTAAAPAAAASPTSAPASSTADSSTAQIASPTTADSTATVPSTGSSSNSGTLTFTLTPGKSTASYKVREQLARLSLPSDAIGKTTSVSGSVTIKADGSIDASSSKFVVDLTTLVSDSAMRDNFIKRSTLQTSQYPDATFVPTQASGLPNPLPSSGEVNFQLTGDMTIHGVTKSITWTVTGTVNGASASGVATTSFKFEDFGLSAPQVSVVLSVVDLITLEIDGTIQSANK